MGEQTELKIKDDGWVWFSPRATRALKSLQDQMTEKGASPEVFDVVLRWAKDHITGVVSAHVTSDEDEVKACEKVITGQIGEKILGDFMQWERNAFFLIGRVDFFGKSPGDSSGQGLPTP